MRDCGACARSRAPEWRSFNAFGRRAGGSAAQNKLAHRLLLLSPLGLAGDASAVKNEEHPIHPRQRIVRERRQYNQWVASQTLEDYALRYTADRARKSSFRVGNTAFGPIAFLACEAIGGALTIAYGFPNTAWAILAFSVLMFGIGLPICYYAAKYGVDIDLLTRGAGFGYMGSTVTSLIYASFTFLLFAIEASILSMALRMLFDVPLAIAHLISSLIVIPIAIYGISLISRVQLVTQPVWLILQLVPLAYIAWKAPADVTAWTQFKGQLGDGSVDF